MGDKLKEALAKLPQKERDAIEREARRAALSKMHPVERREILASAQYVRESIYMVANLNGRRSQPFGDESALELLSKAAQWMNENDLGAKDE
jgi:hypothetical protein